MEPFIMNLYQIREMRESKIPWWADNLSPAEMDGIIIYDRTSAAVQAEQHSNKTNET